MAGSFLALLDDIAAILDDVALLSKVAAKKTTGVLGDDLALNAQQVAGVAADRELPVVWAVAKGSFVNKAILVPAALVISAFIPWAVTPLLMAGGVFLCFEGFEKLAHRFLQSSQARRVRQHEEISALSAPTVDLVAVEKDRIKGAVRTDFILSAEIIAITLGIVQGSALMTQLAVLAGVAIVMTAGVYGLVALIVKLDDAGLYLSRLEGESRLRRKFGRGILWAAPWLMKALSVAGTAAMFLVGGGILTHGIAPLRDAIEALAEAIAANTVAGAWLAALVPTLVNALIGLLAGGAALLAVTFAKRLLAPGRSRAKATTGQ